MKKPKFKPFTGYVGVFRGKADFMDRPGHSLGEGDYYATELFKNKAGAKQWYDKKHIRKVRVEFI